MFEFLEAFEKRMGFVAVVDSIVNRRNRNSEIEDWFGGEELDNIFFSLLVYIMEQTLNENDECTMENMAGFLDDILPAYGKKMSFDQVMRLAEYMVKDILQNKGTAKTYGVMDYERGMTRYQVRLISDKITEDNRIVYQLTDQGYDFLFRTKEVDRELDFKLEQMKLKELLRRKNYRHALKQSRELISMLRQKKREVEDFISRVRQNIHTIDRGEHEKLLKETYELIDEEYEGMLELKTAVDKDEIRIQREVEDSGYLEDSMKDALKNLGMIKRNLQMVIGEQRNLIASRFSMNDTYEETIKNSFHAFVIRRFDFKTELLDRLEQVDERTAGNLWKLFTPLFFPRPDKRLNLSLIYDRQGRLKETETGEERMEEEQLLEDEMVEQRRFLDAIHVRILERVFKFAQDMEGSYTCSQLYRHIVDKTTRLSAYTEGKRFFLIMLKLYEYECVDIRAWKAREEGDIPQTNGEFDLSYCLNQLERKNPDFYGVERLAFEKTGEKFKAVAREASETADGMEEVLERSIIMDDIRVSAVFYHREYDWDIEPEERSRDQDVETGAADL